MNHATRLLLLAVLLSVGCEKKIAPPPSIPGFTPLKKNPEGYHEYKHDKTGIVMVLLPGGQFTMGSTHEEGDRAVKAFMEELGEKAKGTTENRNEARAGVAAERPRHRVTLSSFLIAKHEVPQRIWQAVMGKNPSGIQPEGALAPLVDSWLLEKDRWTYLPVEKVSWHDCQEFLKKTGLSLPTEAQWEYACRAGTRTPYAFGETMTDKQANFLGARLKTAIVGSHEPNAFGLHNMHGNVREWCQDVFSPIFYGTLKAKSPDPVCLEGSEFRVHRGGSWLHNVSNCRSASRSWAVPERSHVDLGLRPVFNLPSDT